MNSTSLAVNANVALYGAMAVLALAMIAYAAYLAWAIPARQSVEVETREVVGAGGPPVTVSAITQPQPQTSGRAPKAAGIARSLTWLGTLLLLASVVLRGLSVSRPPLGNMFEFATAGALAVLVVFSLWSARRDLSWLGVFVVTPALLVLGAALTVWYTEASQLMPALQSYWLVIHVTVAIVAVAFFAIGAATAGLYLLSDRAHRTGRIGLWARFPAPKALERLTYSLHIVAFPLWTFAVIAGAIWARQAWGSYWNWDPKEVWSFVIWVLYAAYLHARATTGWKTRTATLIALAGFAAIIVNYAIVNVYFIGQHSYSGM